MQHESGSPPSHSACGTESAQEIPSAIEAEPQEDVNELKARIAALEKQLVRARAEEGRLTESTKLHTAFFATIAHDLRTPLASLCGFASLVHRDVERVLLPLAKGAPPTESLLARSERVVENLQRMHTEGDRLARLINNLIDLNRMESGYMTWRDRPVQIADCIYDALLAVTNLFSEKPDVSVLTNAPTDLPPLAMDPDRLTQVLVNLLENAALFTDAGEVLIDADVVPAGFVEVRIKDTGPGIAPENLPRIFECSYNASLEDTLDTPRCGSGLGLAICREIIEHYGGEIWAESSPGQGSTFRFRLPLTCEA